MPILTMQRKGREIGRIRLGVQVTTRNGKRAPSKLESFRFTTPSRSIADAVAGLLGGTVQQWQPEGGAAQWEVITEATSLPVIVPPGDAVISQWFELWSGGGCQRRCDGVTVTMRTPTGEERMPCRCPEDPAERNALASSGEACKPTTRLSVMLPDLPDVGVWRVESHGYYAAVELGGSAELLEKARDAGMLLPATLRLEQRQVKRPGGTRRFAVPVLEIGASLRQMAEVGGRDGLQAALPPAPGRALPSGPSAPPTGEPGNSSTPPGISPPPANARPGVAQEIADRLLDLNTREQVAAAWHEAGKAGVLDDMVANPAGELEPLRQLLEARAEEVAR